MPQISFQRLHLAKSRLGNLCIEAAIGVGQPGTLHDFLEGCGIFFQLSVILIDAYSFLLMMAKNKYFLMFTYLFK